MIQLPKSQRIAVSSRFDSQCLLRDKMSQTKRFFASCLKAEIHNDDQLLLHFLRPCAQRRSSFRPFNRSFLLTYYSVFEKLPSTRRADARQTDRQTDRQMGAIFI